MALPKVSLPTDTVYVDGNKVEVRGLSRAEAMKLPTFAGDMDEAEAYILSVGAGVSIEDAKAWREDSPADAVGIVVDRIVELSGLDEGAQKSG